MPPLSFSLSAPPPYKLLLCLPPPPPPPLSLIPSEQKCSRAWCDLSSLLKSVFPAPRNLFPAVIMAISVSLQCLGLITLAALLLQTIAVAVSFMYFNKVLSTVRQPSCVCLPINLTHITSNWLLVTGFFFRCDTYFNYDKWTGKHSVIIVYHSFQRDGPAAPVTQF